MRTRTGRINNTIFNIHFAIEGLFPHFAKAPYALGVIF